VGLTPEQFAAGTRVYENPRDVAEQDQCCICQEGITTEAAIHTLCPGPALGDGVTSTNHHALHRRCATAWFAISTKCPVCRADLRTLNPTTTMQEQQTVASPPQEATLPTQPLVVVCTPTYNRRFCLDFSVECFKRQTYPNLHWIIVDNSDDPEKDWSPIQQKEKEGIKITYFHIKTRKPVGYLRNVCLKEAMKLSPEFIAFWDDDDYYMPNVSRFPSKPCKRTRSTILLGALS